MNSPLSWDEFRLIKAIADARSLVGAAEGLGLNHSTIFRRLGAVEETLGIRLFERSRAGYLPTPAGEEMVALATTMADSVVAFERHVVGRDVKATGQLRVTTVDSIAVCILPPLLARFRQANPGVTLDINLSPQHLNLSRRDADVAIRATNDPPETLVGRRVSGVRWAVYSSRELAAEYGAGLMEAAPWIGFSDNFGAPAVRRWTEEKIGLRRVVCRVNSVLTLAETIAAGAGAGVLPCYVGDRRDGLARFGKPIGELDIDLWLLTHPDLRHAARVRAFTDFIGAELVRLRKTLEGA